MIIRIDPPIPLETPKGSALAHFLIDYGAENNLLWVCFLNNNGQIWTYDNTEVRAPKNITMKRKKPEKLK